MKKSTLTAAIALSTVLMTTAEAAQEIKVTTAAPNGTPWIKHLETSSKTLLEKSRGELSLAVFPASQLGAETETIKQVSRGRLDMGAFSVNAASAVVPELSLITTPFFWDSSEQAECALNGDLTDVFNPLLEKRGLRVLQWQNLGWLNLFSVDGALTDPSSVDAQKLRVANSKSSEVLWKGVGAAGVPLALSDTAPSLETGMVKGGELPTISYVASGISKIAPHLTNTKHIYTPVLLLISTKTWNKLGSESQTVFDASLASAAELSTQVNGAIGFFEGKLLEQGGTITNLTPEQREAWKATFTADMQQQLIDSVGGDAQSIFDAMVKARNACS